jgi:di/tricarboxylate transporter
MIAADTMVLMWATLALAGGAIVAFTHPRIPLELTSVTLVALLLALFQLAGPDRTPLLSVTQLLEGFANPALIAVVALLVIGQGLVRAGALDAVSHAIFAVARGQAGPAIALALITVLVISAVLNNTPVVVVFIPILGALAERIGRPASRLMMLLSYSAILGGMTTLIGSSTNLLVAGTAAELGVRPIGFFDFTIPGLVLAALGLLYVLFVAPRLLRDRQSEGSRRHGLGGRQFIAQLTLDRDAVVTGTLSIGGMFPGFGSMTVLHVQRGNTVFRPPFEDVALRAGDAVIVAATRKVLTEAIARDPGLRPSIGLDVAAGRLGSGLDEPEPRTTGGVSAEAMVAPGSRLAGLPLEQVALTAFRGAIVGIQRRPRMTRARINEVRLEAGDVLLVQGPPRDVHALRDNRDVVLMEWSAQELPARHHARRAGAIFLGVVAVGASGALPIAVAAVAGAALMIMTGVLNIRQAGRAIDRQIIMVGGAALALNAALTATGGAAFVADNLIGSIEGAGVVVVLSAFFLLVALLTNVLTNYACAVLFTPIGVSLAQGLGVDPFIFVVAVILAANCSFASPIGYVTNLLVMAPGRYVFTDFVRTGAPLILLLWIAFSLFAPWYYDLW